MTRPTRRVTTPSDGPLYRKAWPGPVETAGLPPHRAPAELPGAPGSRPVTDAGLARWRLREDLRALQPHPRQRKCGRTPLGPVQLGPGWILGLAQCGSVHACPVCSARVRSERATEIRALVAGWKTANPDGGAGLLTLTVRHAWGSDLAELRRGLAGAWRRLWQGSAAAELRRPVAHLIRAVDTTHGDAGWHPHLHVLALYPRGAPGEEWRAELARRWANAVAAELGTGATPREDDVGVRWDATVRSDYLVKLGLEVAGADKRTKLRGPLRADPWEIARRATAEAGRVRSGESTGEWVRLWQHFARSMRGARALTWSRGTHRLAERSVEVEESGETTAYPWVVVVSPTDWVRTMLYTGARYDLPAVLSATTVGPDATIDVLAANGCKARQLAVTEVATVLGTTGAIFEPANAFAARRWLDETHKRAIVDTTGEPLAHEA